jgi:hypothetical protein
MEMSWLVVLDDWQPIDPRPLASEVAKAFHISVLEAKMQLKKAGALVVQDVPEMVARKIHELLKDQGVASHVLPAAANPLKGSPIRISSLSEFEGMLQLNGERPLLCAWDSIRIVSAALIRAHSVSEPAVLQIPSEDLTPEEVALMRENAILRMAQPRRTDTPPPQPAKRKTVLDQIEMDAVKDIQPVLDLVMDDNETWVRISADSLIYARGKLKVGGGLAFSTLLKDLVRECPADALTPITLNCFAGHDIREVALASIAELSRYTSWFAIRKTIST